MDALGALAHERRLAAFRALVRAGPDGLAAGILAQNLDVAASTLSASLNVLSRAGLVNSRRDGRSIIYTADYSRMRDLLAYLLDECCGGQREICEPLADLARQLAACGASPGAPARQLETEEAKR